MVQLEHSSDAFIAVKVVHVVSDVLVSSGLPHVGNSLIYPFACRSSSDLKFDILSKFGDIIVPVGSRDLGCQVLCICKLSGHLSILFYCFPAVLLSRYEALHNEQI